VAWYRNHYACEECGHAWEDEWSCCCDDECGECGASDMEAIESDDLTIQVFDVAGSPGLFSISISPATAGHDPDYEDMCDEHGEPLIFADRDEAVAYLVANADAIAAAREAAEDAVYG
jgi:hypothetical protein